jgi:RNA polymerase sigma-70 factor (ECF subfamily)
MDRHSLNDRLSHISTLWTVLFQAHQSEKEAATAAQRALVQRYSGAVYRYLLGAVRDEDVASDLAQEFALRFLRGDFRRAAPERGRFRDYLKKALIHLVTDHHRARQKQPSAFAANSPEAIAPRPDSEQDFVRAWCEELLERTMQALAAANAAYHAVLLCRIEDPNATSAEMAEQLSARLGKEVTAAWERKTRQRAHDKFAELLIEEVAGSLEGTSPAALEAELRELDLLKYCQTALARRNIS